MDRREQLKWAKVAAAAVTLGLAFAMPASAQTSGGSSGGGQSASTGQSMPSEREDGRSNWGWLGLLGLAGLAGLRRRDHHEGVRRTT